METWNWALVWPRIRLRKSAARMFVDMLKVIVSLLIKLNYRVTTN